MQEHPLSNALGLLGFDVSKNSSYDLFTTFTDCMNEGSHRHKAIIKREFWNLNPSLTMYIQVFDTSDREHIDSLICRVEKNVNVEATPEEHKHSDQVFFKIGDWLDNHPSKHLYLDTNKIGVGRGVTVSIPDSSGSGQNSGAFQNLVEDLCQFLESS
jgi:hypothetical protein